MPNPLEDVFKVCGSVGTMVTGGWGFLGKIQKRFGQIQDITQRGGKPGLFFFLAYRIFQYIYAAGLIVCGLAGLGLLVGGVAKIVSPPNGLPYLTPFFDNFVLQILALAILIFLVALLNVLSWIVILLFAWVPARALPLKESAAWYNLCQFSLPLSEPKPIFINPQGISTLADIAISKLENYGPTSQDFAGTPTELTLDERANAALIGCLFEKEHSVRGWAKPNWDAFYAAVAAAEVNSRRLVSPAYLTSLPPDCDFYSIFTGEVNRRLPEGQPKIPDSAGARNDLSNAVKILVRKYRGSARNLAFRWRGWKPRLRLAFSRSQAFRPFDVSSMVPQFLKLAVRWGTWPNVKPGNFIYPYASNLALLLFEKRAMLTLPSVESLAFKQAGQLAAYREAMRRAVQRVKEDLTASNKPRHRAILAGCATEWELASAVDFTLWAYSSDLKKGDGFKQWKLDENGFVARIGSAQSQKAATGEGVPFSKEN
jgi:hypothetical protein